MDGVSPDSKQDGIGTKAKTKHKTVRAKSLGNSWYMALSEKHNIPYYFNTETRERTWHPPKILNEKDSWEQHWDSNHQQHFYFNRATGESSWENPFCQKCAESTHVPKELKGQPSGNGDTFIADEFLQNAIKKATETKHSRAFRANTDDSGYDGLESDMDEFHELKLMVSKKTNLSESVSSPTDAPPSQEMSTAGAIAPIQNQLNTQEFAVQVGSTKPVDLGALSPNARGHPLNIVLAQISEMKDKNTSSEFASPSVNQLTEAKSTRRQSIQQILSNKINKRQNIMAVVELGNEHVGNAPRNMAPPGKQAPVEKAGDIFALHSQRKVSASISSRIDLLKESHMKTVVSGTSTVERAVRVARDESLGQVEQKLEQKHACRAPNSEKNNVPSTKYLYRRSEPRIVRPSRGHARRMSFQSAVSLFSDSLKDSVVAHAETGWLSEEEDHSNILGASIDDRLVKPTFKLSDGVFQVSIRGDGEYAAFSETTSPEAVGRELLNDLSHKFTANPCPRVRDLNSRNDCLLFLESNDKLVQLQ